MIENAFIKANRHDKETSLRGTLNRSEFLYFLLMLIWTRYGFSLNRKFGSGTVDVGPDVKDIQRYVDDFIEDLFLPEYNSSSIHTDRTLIRSSDSLNLLLFDNKDFLSKLYSQYSKDQIFTLESAKKMLLERVQGKIESTHFSKLKVTEWFNFSQMTVKDERKDREKYYQMSYIEFLEMVCRAAVFFEPEKAVYDSVYAILADIGDWTEIKTVDDDVRKKLDNVKAPESGKVKKEYMATIRPKVLKDPETDQIITYSAFLMIMKRYIRFFRKHIMLQNVEFLASSDDSEIEPKDKVLRLPLGVNSDDIT